jgi:hypothetical protein
MLRKFLLLLALSSSSLLARAQLYTGATGMFVKSGTTLSTDSMVWVPSADFSLSGTTLSATATPITATGGASIRKILQLSNPLQFQGTLGLYYRDDQLNGNTAANLQLAYRDSLPNGWTTTTGTTVNAAAHYLSYTLAAPQQLSRITATSTGVSLPLNLVRFTAAAAGSRVRLDWEMIADAAREIQVQRSAEGKRFTAIGSVPVSTQEQDYRLYDEAPLAGKNYYRLYWNDEGREKYSPVRTVDMALNSNKLSLHPVPASDRLHIRFPSQPQSGDYVQLLSLDGKVLLQQNCQGNTMSLDMQAYPIGVYLLSWVNGSTVNYYRIPKK